MKLIKIADLFLGILRSREQTTEKSENVYNLIDYSSIVNRNISFEKIKTFYSKESISKNLILRKGDILLKLNSPISFFYLDYVAKNCIVSTNFAVIRAHEEYDSKIIFFLLKEKENELNRRLLDGTEILVRTLRLNSLQEIEINYSENIFLKKLTKLNFLYRKLIDLVESKKEILKKQEKYYGGIYGK